MYRCVGVVLILTSALVLTAGWASEPTSGELIVLHGHRFRLPPGFTIELVATSPLIQRPITADFDEQGNLYVGEASGTNDNVQKQLRDKPHRIKKLILDPETGTYRRATVFAADLMLPQGTLWHAGSLYVAAPPSIWKLTDHDGDGCADERVEWLPAQTLTGCANDLHGPYLGPDGWMYWCKGAFAQQSYARDGQKPFKSKAAHVYRARLDGSGREPVLTGGMDNPVGLAFLANGDCIVSATFVQHPGGGKRDGLVHTVHGGIYGKDHQPIYDHPWSGPTLMPVLSHLGPAAPSGMTRYQGTAFEAEYRDNLFTALFNLHKVTRHVLTPEGATYRASDSDFLVSDQIDFHPTDVLEDADGSLLVIDTGGWYKICCPTSQFPKPDILGGIYRVRRKNAPLIADPRGMRIAWNSLEAVDLAGLLADMRPAVRRQAMRRLAQSAAGGRAAAQVLASSAELHARQAAAWVLCQRGDAPARAALRQLLASPEAELRAIALHAVHLHADADAAPELRRLLRSGSMPERRKAAAALGRLRDRLAIPEILSACTSPGDRVLEHALVYALIEIGEREPLVSALSNADPAVRRAALIALDQMAGGQLSAASVVAELRASDSTLRTTARWIAGRHPEWGGVLANYIAEQLVELAVHPAQDVARKEFVNLAAQGAREQQVQNLLAQRGQQGAARERELVFAIMAASGQKTFPISWQTSIQEGLAADDPNVRRAAIQAAQACARGLPADRQSAMRVALLRLAENPRVEEHTRLQAFAALPGGLEPIGQELFTWLRGRLQAGQGAVERALAVGILAEGQLTAAQRVELLDDFAEIGPAAVARLLDSFARPPCTETVGQRLVATLRLPAVRAGLRLDQVQRVLAPYPPVVQEAAQTLYAEMGADLAGQERRLNQALAKLGGGDVRRGQSVFLGSKAACSTCHAIGYVGGQIGPDLSAIGRIRSERDLLEAVLFPSASFVRSYEPWLVELKNGQVFNGLLRQETEEAITLALSATEERRFARDDIESLQPSRVSIMPAGLDQQLSEQELADLIAFLKACK